MLGLYIHIPFCVRKCQYCDFLSAPACDSEREAYLQSLYGQIKAFGVRLKQKQKHYTVDSIFIGGGTPSIYPSEDISDILFELEKRLDISSYSKNDARVFGFVSERLLDVWVETKGCKYCEMPVIFMEKQNWWVKGTNFLKRKFFGKK